MRFTRRLAREKRRRWSSREIPQNRRLSVCHGCLLCGARVVVPSMLRRQVLDLLHECHLGIQRMKQLARTAVYWPDIDSDILDLCRQCSTCAGHQSEPSKAAVHPWMFAKKLWSHLQYILIMPSTFWVSTGLWLLMLVQSIPASMQRSQYQRNQWSICCKRISRILVFQYSRNRLRGYLQIWRVPGVLQREWNCPSDWSSVPSCHQWRRWTFGANFQTSFEEVGQSSKRCVARLAAKLPAHSVINRLFAERVA